MDSFLVALLILTKSGIKNNGWMKTVQNHKIRIFEANNSFPNTFTCFKFIIINTKNIINTINERK